MTDQPETDIEPAVADWFRERYEDGAETQVWQPEPRWYCDIVVEVGFARLYIEVENDADSVRPGMGQAIAYAGQDPIAGIPMVVTPKDHLDEARAERLRCWSPAIIREFDTEEMEFAR